MKNKKFSFLFSFFLLFSLVSNVSAQSSAVKSVQKSVFTLKTYDKAGKQLSTGYGIFAGGQGEAVSHFKPFDGAYRAEVWDYSGKVYQVHRIIGANESHNLIRFSVEGKTVPAKLLEGAVPEQGAKLFCVGPKQGGKIAEAAVKATEPFLDKYTYYTVKMAEKEGLGACPFVTEKGQVIGLLEVSATSSDVFSSDIRYAATLQASGFSVGMQDLQKVHIPIRLPSDQKDAQLAMVMLHGDSVKHVGAALDYMEAFPKLSEGYTTLAQIEVSKGNYSRAEELLQNAVQNVDDKDAVHYEYARLIAANTAMQEDRRYAPWTLEKALAEVQAANAIKKNLAYLQFEAEIILAQGRYQEALDRFITLAKQEEKPAELYFQAARCKQFLEAPNEEVVALLDSAVNHIDSLNIVSAAPYFWMRGAVLDQMGKYRDAVLDYSRYQVVMNNRVNDIFFYTRFQAEVNGRLYQQALLDIENCIYLNPQEPLYPAEKAQLELRVGEVDAAIVSANYCIKIAPENYTGYTLLALAQVKKEQKAEALQNFLKAKELGDPQAESLIEKYQLK